MSIFKVINNKLKLTKEITELDKFVFELISIIEKYSRYVIISGYVSIFFGRARSTEDVDIFLEKISFDKFMDLIKALQNYEITENAPKKLYDDYLLKGDAINIWKKDFPLLRLEVKFALKNSQIIQLQKKIEVNLNNEYKLYFSNVESQIAYKRYFLRSEKDLEDARHLEIVFNADKDKIKYFKDIFLKDEKR